MTHRECIERAVQAIKSVCREEEPNSGGQMVIGDLATWEIEAKLIAAVTRAIRSR